jgi:serine/threonine protein kinase
MDVIHRDVKPDNIFLTDENELVANVKLGDFGLARFNENSEVQKTLQAGTPLFTAPEVSSG